MIVLGGVFGFSRFHVTLLNGLTIISCLLEQRPVIIFPIDSCYKDLFICIITLSEPQLIQQMKVLLAVYKECDSLRLKAV